MDTTPPLPRLPRQDTGTPDTLPHHGAHAIAERDALYRENLACRAHPRRLEPGAIDAVTPVSVLGLEQITISRLYRAGYVRVRQLLDTSVEKLWRSIGRHGITDIIDRLTFQGLALQPLNDYERWRLGLVDRSRIRIRVDITLDSLVADLWPRLGLTLADLLQKRGLHRVADLAPRDAAELLTLYRLGKNNLRKIHDVLEDLLRQADGVHFARLRQALQLIAERSELRRGSGAAQAIHHHEMESSHDPYAVAPSGGRTSIGGLHAERRSGK